MQFLNKNEFIGRKKSDTLVIYGCGYSINDLTEEDFSRIGRYDSVAFNWFCKSDIPVTFYVVREQCVPDFRELKGERLSDLYRSFNSYYKDSVFIVHRGDHLVQKSGYSHFLYHNKIQGSGIIIDDIRMRASKVKKNPKVVIDKFNDDIFQDGVQHGLLTMYNVMHIATFLKYTTIIFVGVDLYDSRYFWLGEKESRRILKNKNRTYKSVHSTKGSLFQLLKIYKKTFPHVQLYTYSDKSLLTKVMEVMN